MDPFSTRQLGQTRLQVPILGMGGGPLGNLRETITEQEADATVAAAWDAGIRFYDTAPFYGHTRSEHRIGRNLWDRPRDEYVLSTKVGRIYHRPGADGFQAGGWPAGLPFNFRLDYTRDGVLRSYEDSLQRLGLPRVDALLVHDLDPGAVGSQEEWARHLDLLEREGGFGALEELRDTGEISAVGVGINCIGMIPHFLQRFHVDFFIVAMPYTLLTQEALEAELPLCAERGSGVVIGAPFASGILAVGAESSKATYGYRPPAGDVVEKARRINAVCERHGVPIGAAALQFPLAHPLVAAVIPGPMGPEQVRTNVEWMGTPIPADLWSELKSEGLIRPDAPTP